MEYKYNAIGADCRGYFRLKSFHKNQGGCDYNEIEIDENGKTKVIDSGFFTTAEIKALDPIQ